MNCPNLSRDVGQARSLTARYFASELTTSGRYDGHCLNLDLGAILHQGHDLHHGHRGKVAPHDLAIDPSDALEIAEIVLLVRQLPCHRHEMCRLGAGLGQHVDDVLQRLPDLTDEIVGFEPTLPVPANLPADK